MKKKTVLSVVLVLMLLVCFGLPAFAQDEGEDDDDDDEEESSSEDNDSMMDSEADEGSDEASEEDEKGEAGERAKIQLPLQKKAKVVQSRTYNNDLRAELGVFFGLAPFDALMTSIMAGGRLNFHIDNMFALEAQGAYVVNFENNLKQTLKDAQIPSEFTENAEPLGHADLRFIWYLIYGKFSLVSSVIQNYDFGIAVGPSLMFLQDDDMIGGVNAGIVGDIYFLNWLSLRLDFTYYAMIAKDKRIEPDTATETGLAAPGSAGISGTARGGTLLRNFYFITIGPSFHLPPN